MLSIYRKYLLVLGIFIAIIPTTFANQFYDIEIHEKSLGGSFVKAEVANIVNNDIDLFISHTMTNLSNYPGNESISAIITFKYPQVLSTVLDLDNDQVEIISVILVDEQGMYQEEPPIELSEVTPTVPIEIFNQNIIGVRLSATTAVLYSLYEMNIIAVVDPGPIDVLTDPDNEELILSRPLYDEYVNQAVAKLENSTNSLPKVFLLRENYPNPFNPTTEISFDLPKASNVEILVFNILGQKTKTLLNKQMEPGTHFVTWNGTDENGVSVSSGVYLLKVYTDEFSDSKKMLLLK